MDPDPLRDPSVAVVVTYAPAGLGHLRVADALIDGLPEGVRPVLMRAEEEYTQSVHRWFSVTRLTRWISVWFQHGIQEELFTRVYTRLLQFTAGNLYHSVETVLNEHSGFPKTVLFVATHYALAHQLSVIKKGIITRYGVRVLLIVQVTDDSPQLVWYVPGADCIVVPSDRTKTSLLRYAQMRHMPEVNFVVAPYPVSEKFRIELSQNGQARSDQLSSNSVVPIHVAVPVSGAAVGLSFARDLTLSLHRASDRYYFHIVAKHSSQTRSLLAALSNLPFVTTHSAEYDRGIVNVYETLYERVVIGLEVTKPSEQSFKALCTPKERGGAILLFSEPVGKQEWDNLNFLERHDLLPDSTTQQILWRLSKRGGKVDVDILTRALRWRGLRLPADPARAAAFIHWCLTQQIFSQMANCALRPTVADAHKHELNSSGVEVFWDVVRNLICSVSSE